MIIFIFWIALSFIVASIGSDRRVGFVGALLWSLLLSPLIGLIITLASESNSSIKEREDTRRLLDAQNEMIRKQTETLNKLQDPNYLTEEEKDQISKNNKIEEFRQKLNNGEISLAEFNNIEKNILGVHEEPEKSLFSSENILYFILALFAIALLYNFLS